MAVSFLSFAWGPVFGLWVNAGIFPLEREAKRG